MNEDEMFFEEDEFLETDSPVNNNNTGPTESDNSTGTQEPVQLNEDSDLTSDVLRVLGISDPNNIQFVDDSGAVIERSWDSLSRNEQLAILTQHEDLETSLDDDEINLINNIRQSQLTPEQYLNQVKQQYLNQVNSQSEPTSRVDDMDDDYLYVLDLMDKVGADNITDEELEEALQNAKSNEELFKKTVDGLRVQYKNREQDILLKQQEERNYQAQMQYQNFVHTITNGIDSFTNLGNQEIELTPDDKEDLAHYILTLNEHGMSQFGIDMNRPEKMIEAAFFMKKGPEILGELSKQIQIAYTRGYDQAKRDIENKSTIVFSPRNNNNTTMNQKPFDSIDDDDDWA